MMKKLLSICASVLILTSASFAVSADKLSQYVYEDTKQLVALVEDAASLMEKEGISAFKEFSQYNSRWYNDKYYLFVYTASGECVFHPIEPSLVGKNIINFTDIDARPVIKMITDVSKQPGSDASGWVFYKWEDPWGSSFPEWKSSYIRKAVTPDKGIYLIGCGLYKMKTERMFIEQQVNKACELMKLIGKDSLVKALKDRSKSFDIMDSSITVVNSKGDMEFSPNFPSIKVSRNVRDLVDKTGKKVGNEAVIALKDKDRVWVSYVWPKEDVAKLSRKLLYIRRVRVRGEDYFVYMDFFPALPIWMK